MTNETIFELNEIEIEFNLSRDQLLGFGQECFVYKSTENEILKIYSNNYATKIEDIQILKKLYDNLPRNVLQVELPEIYEVFNLNNHIVSREKLLNGVLITNRWSNLSVLEKSKCFESLVQFASNLGKICQTNNTYSDISLDHQSVDWKSFLITKFKSEIGQKSSLYSADKVNLEQLVLNFENQFPNSIKSPTSCLVHGDLFFENVLFDEATLQVKAIFDFSSDSLWGDNLMDVVGSIMFTYLDGYIDQSCYENMLTKQFQKYGDEFNELFKLYSVYYAVHHTDAVTKRLDPNFYEKCIGIMKSFC